MEEDLSSRTDHERIVQRSAVVDTLEEAFAFAFTACDEEGMDTPTVEVSPDRWFCWRGPDCEDCGGGGIRFQVIVRGHSEP
jgi:hypothetical protein